MPVRNANLANGTTTVAGVTTVYTVPAQQVVLLKWFSVYNGGAATAHVNGRIHDPNGTGYAFLFSQDIAAAAFYDWSGWVALNAGQTILVQSSSTTLVWWIAGAVLPFNAAL